MAVDIFGEEIDNRAEWTKEWQGMPEFSNLTDEEYCNITVRCTSKEDFDAFCVAIGQKIVLSKSGTKSIWYPKKKQPESVERFF